MKYVFALLSLSLIGCTAVDQGGEKVSDTLDDVRESKPVSSMNKGIDSFMQSSFIQSIDKTLTKGANSPYYKDSYKKKMELYEKDLAIHNAEKALRKANQSNTPSVEIKRLETQLKTARHNLKVYEAEEYLREAKFANVSKEEIARIENYLKTIRLQK